MEDEKQSDEQQSQQSQSESLSETTLRDIGPVYSREVDSEELFDHGSDKAETEVESTENEGNVEDRDENNEQVLTSVLAGSVTGISIGSDISIGGMYQINLSSIILV